MGFRVRIVDNNILTNSVAIQNVLLFTNSDMKLADENYKWFLDEEQSYLINEIINKRHLKRNEIFITKGGASKFFSISLANLFWIDDSDKPKKDLDKFDEIMKQQFKFYQMFKHITVSRSLICMPKIKVKRNKSVNDEILCEHVIKTILEYTNIYPENKCKQIFILSNDEEQRRLLNKYLKIHTSRFWKFFKFML